MPSTIEFMLQHGGLLNRKFWMYINMPWLLNSIDLLLMLPVAFISGGLYFQAIWALKKGKGSARKTTLTRAFFALWAAWILCVFPYEVLDIYFMKNDRLGLGKYIVKPREIMFAVTMFGSDKKHMIFVESCAEGKLQFCELRLATRSRPALD